MLGNLLDPFDFCVYDERLQRYQLRSGGVFIRRIQDRDAAAYGMWLTIPAGIPGLNPGSLLVEYRYSMGAYSGTTEQARTELAYTFGALFSVFLQGVVLGWHTVEHSVDDGAGSLHDEIPVHSYLNEESVFDVLAAWGLSAHAVRKACRDDLLNFAVHVHAEKGAHQRRPFDRLIEAGFARLPYPSDLIHGVVRDLYAEHKLTGTRGEACLPPLRFDEETKNVNERLIKWVQQLKEIGTKRGWLSQDILKETDPMPSDPRKVFVIHGRDLDASNAMFDFLSSIGLHPVEWSTWVHETGSGTPYIGEVLEIAFQTAQAFVVLMTPDDEARLRQDYVQATDLPHERTLTPQPRANVLFEAGMAMGKNPKRTILVELGSLRPFSDVGGRHTIKMDGSLQRRQDLANRLKGAGCPVEITGNRWHTAGTFPLR